MRPRVDRELVAGTVAHYEDAAYYAHTYARRTDDVDFYVRIARRFRGPILEYGCGSGRILLPLARAGHDVVGVDLSRSMLDDLRARLEREPDAVRRRVAFEVGDMRALELRRTFRLVLCTFNTFLHLYTRRDVERFLARVRGHLAPRGRFVFDVSNPEPAELARDPDRLFRTRPFVYPGVGRVRYGERFDYDKLTQLLHVSMEFEPASGEELFMTPLVHRQFYPQELEALLHYNGFSVERVVGDWNERREATRDSGHLVFFCRSDKEKRTRRR